MAEGEGGYRLDGIPTGFTVMHRVGGTVRVACRCGWVDEIPEGWAVHEPRDVEKRNAVRFHHANCSQARVMFAKPDSASPYDASRPRGRRHP
jgi:hypothetical protein